MDRREKPVQDVEVDPIHILIDGLAIVVIIASLSIAHFVFSDSLKQTLTYHASNPELHALVGNWLVHISDVHLIGNLEVFALLSLVGYAVTIWMGELRWFRLSLLGNLLITPIVVNSLSSLRLSMTAHGGATSQVGFSGVVAGIAGMVFILFLGLVRRYYEARAVLTVGGTITLLLLGEVVYSYSSPTMVTIGIFGTCLVLLVLLDSAERIWRSGLDSVRSRVLAEMLVLGVLVTGTLMVTVSGLFPGDIPQTEPMPNLYGHAVGFVSGGIITFVGHRYWTGLDWI